MSSSGRIRLPARYVFSGSTAVKIEHECKIKGQKRFHVQQKQQKQQQKKMQKPEKDAEKIAGWSLKIEDAKIR